MVTILQRQTSRVNGAPTVEPTGVPLASNSDERVTAAKMVPQVATRSRSKHKIGRINPPPTKGAKKPKHEEQKQQYINPIPQQMATARSQLRKAQSRRDRNENRRKKKATPFSAEQYHEDSIDMNHGEDG